MPGGMGDPLRSPIAMGRTPRPLRCTARSGEFFARRSAAPWLGCRRIAVRAKFRSMLYSMGAGAMLGGVALLAWHAPAHLGALNTGSPLSLPAAVSPSSRSPVASRSPRGSPDAAVEPAASAACPPDMTLVDGDFCPALAYECGRPTGAVGCAEYPRGARCSEPSEHRRYCIDRYEWPNEIGQNPTVYVDWFEAKALCAGAGKRLCRRSEWILACEGPKRLPFPWGFVRQPSPCNIDRPTMDFDVRAMMKDDTREGELARLWQADPIGTHPNCVSAYGAYDMSGNVDEWTDDQADNPATRHPSTLNGGYWGPVRDTCRLTTTSHGPTFKFYQVGFRCCAGAGDDGGGPQTPGPDPR